MCYFKLQLSFVPGGFRERNPGACFHWCFFVEFIFCLNKINITNRKVFTSFFVTFQGSRRSLNHRKRKPGNPCRLQTGFPSTDHDIIAGNPSRPHKGFPSMDHDVRFRQIDSDYIKIEFSQSETFNETQQHHVTKQRRNLTGSDLGTGSYAWNLAYSQPQHHLVVESPGDVPVVGDSGVSPKKSKSFVCEFCGKVYGTWAGRYYHNQMKHGAEKKFQCQLCDKGFPKGSDLNRHKWARHKESYSE